jgi:putative oxidoreductase
MTLNQFTATRAFGAVVLIRLYVGLIFAGEGVLKFLRPDQLGPGRFDKAGIPASTLLAYLDGILEIGCGVMILAGLLTRLATVPLIIDMIGALGITKVPLLWGCPAVPERRRLLGLLPRRPSRGGDAVRQRLSAHCRRWGVFVRRPDEP